MNAKIILLISLFVFSNCGFSNNSKESAQINNTLYTKIVKNKPWAYMQNDTVFIPDTTINKLLLLNNDISVINHIGDTDDLLVHGKDYFPYVYFVNKSGKQYIKMTIFAGGWSNSFDIFEIGNVSFIKNEVLNKSDFEDFYTESGIHLGMSQAEVKKIKGNHFVETIQKEMNIITYRISENSDFDGDNFTSKFLERNGTAYRAEYYFKNNILVKFSYGFEYI